VTHTIATAVLEDVTRSPIEEAPERRRSARERRNLPAWLSAAAGSRSDTGYNVTVTDLSMHGVGFDSSQKLTVGASHWMVVSGQAMRLSTRLQVVSCRPNPEGGYHCGGEFF
jgi:hypothetical protein